MKRWIWCAALLLVCSASLRGQQTYLPFIEEGKTWVCSGRYSGEDAQGDYQYVYTLRGDTLIDGKTMKKVFLTDSYVYGDAEPHLFGALYDVGYRTFLWSAETGKSAFVHDMGLDGGASMYLGSDIYMKADKGSYYLYSSIVREWQSWYGGTLSGLMMSGSVLEGIGFVVVLDPFRLLDGFEAGKGTVEFLRVEAVYSQDRHYFTYSDFLTAFYQNLMVAATYRPVLSQGRQWRVGDAATEYVSGDTLLHASPDMLVYSAIENSYGQPTCVYQKVYRIDANKYGDTQPHYEKAIREEGYRVYEIPAGKSENERQLLFDFGLTAGGRIDFSNGDHAIVQHIDSIESEGHRYRRLTLQLYEGQSDTGRTIHWTEGIGGDYGLSASFASTAAADQLLTVYDGAERIYAANGLAEVADIRHTAVRKATPSVVYDLQGRRLADPPAKGIYVKNGRKVYTQQ